MLYRFQVVGFLVLNYIVLGLSKKETVEKQFCGGGENSSYLFLGGWGEIAECYFVRCLKFLLFIFGGWGEILWRWLKFLLFFLLLQWRGEVDFSLSGMRSCTSYPEPVKKKNCFAKFF